MSEGGVDPHDVEVTALKIEITKLRGHLIDTVGITVQIYSVLSAMHPRGFDEKSKAVDAEMKALMERIKQTISDIKG